jgi:nucleoid-associated protein YgaU
MVVVRPGDSLWRIASRHLPAGANAATIDAASRLWYAANRSVIGDDPNLIVPGQHLHAPHSEVTR